MKKTIPRNIGCIVVQPIGNDIDDISSSFSTYGNIETYSIESLDDDTISLIKARYAQVNFVIDFHQLRKNKHHDILKDIFKYLDNIIKEIFIIYTGHLKKEDFDYIMDVVGDNSIKFIPSEDVPLRTQHYTPIEEEGEYGDVKLILNWKSIPETIFDVRSRTYLPKDLPNEVYRHSLIDERYWYWDEQGSSLWLYLKDAKNYAFFASTYELLTRNVADIIGLIIKDSNLESRLANDNEYIDLIVQGVGSTEKEIFILEQLVNAPKVYGIREFPGTIDYLPIDVSFPLLQNTIRIALSNPLLKEYFIRRKIFLKPILADFLAIHKDLVRGQNKIKFFVALGVLVNLPENDFFAQMEKLMDEDDYILIDMEFIADRDDSQLKKSYLSRENYDLVYHPLELLCRVGEKSNTVFDVQIGREKKSVPYSYFSSYKKNTKEPSSNFLVELIENNSLISLKSILKKVGFGDSIIKNFSKNIESAKDKIRFSDLSKSKTVVTLYIPLHKDNPPIMLGYSTKYDYNEVIEYINERTDFEILKEYLDRNKTFGYFLLKKKVINNV